MVFRDSLQFLPASLEQLAALLAKVGRGYFQNLHDVVIDVYIEADVELLERKGVFFYDYVDFFARLDEPALPPREAFFNKLGGVEFSQADFAHAQQVWENYHCQSLKEYMALYLLSDIACWPTCSKRLRITPWTSTSWTRPTCERAATCLERSSQPH